MEKYHNAQNSSPAFTPAFTERDKQLLMLYHDICDYLGWSTGQGEHQAPNLNSSPKELDYLLAISG